jgi:uncharacterized membrane-anchored protein
MTMRARTVALAALGLSLSAFAYADGKQWNEPVRPKPVETKPAPIGTPTPSKLPTNNPKPAPAPKPAPTINTQPLPPPPPPITTAQRGQTGQVALPSGFALNVPVGYVFFPATDAHGHMARLDKAPPPGEVFGIIAPAGKLPGDSDFWGAVVSFNGIGRVPDDTADAVSRPGFLEIVKKGRTTQAPDAFITAPAWDAPGKTLTWAELYPTKGPQDRNIREEARILTRDGALGFTALVNPASFPDAKRDMRKFASAVTLPTGRRYADAAIATDRVAEYDVPGLISSLKRGQTPGGVIAALPSGPTTPGPTTPSAGTGTPLSGGTPLSPVGPDAKAASTPAEGGMVAPEWLTKYFPWIAAGVVGVPLLLWLLFGRRRREEYWDENLTPR